MIEISGTLVGFMLAGLLFFSWSFLCYYVGLCKGRRPPVARSPFAGGIITPRLRKPPEARRSQ